MMNFSTQAAILMAEREGNRDATVREVEHGKGKEMASGDLRATWIHLSAPCQHKLLPLCSPLHTFRARRKQPFTLKHTPKEQLEGTEQLFFQVKACHQPFWTWTFSMSHS